MLADELLLQPCSTTLPLSGNRQGFGCDASYSNVVLNALLRDSTLNARGKLSERIALT